MNPTSNPPPESTALTSGEPGLPPGQPSPTPTPTSTTSARFGGKTECAEALGISQRSLEDLMANGGVPYVKLGRRVRFFMPDVVRHVLTCHRFLKGQPSPLPLPGDASSTNRS